MVTVTATELHDRTAELTEQAMREPQSPVMVEKRGKPAVVLIDARFYEGLMETLDLLADPQAMTLIRRSLAEADAGQLISHAEVVAEIGSNGQTSHFNRVDTHRPERTARSRKPKHATKNRR